MATLKYDRLIKETDYLIKEMNRTFGRMVESEGIDVLFYDLKKFLPKITMLPNNVINANKYQEHEIVDGLKNIGYEYKKPIGSKLHFFNRKTSISVYLAQNTRYVTLQP